jgi:four helix bundle protein
MTNDEKAAQRPRRFDLEERTARFGEAIIAFAKRVPANLVTQPLIPQLVDSGTSVGANYCEADDAGTKKEFKYRISLCKRESRESKHWLRMLAAAVPDMKEEARTLWREAKELNLIFSAIYRGKRAGP